MRILGQSWWRAWMLLAYLAFAVVIGLFAIALASTLGVGFVLTWIMLVALFAIFGMGHYFLWGQLMAADAEDYRRHMVRRTPPASLATFVLECDDKERAELLRVLEHSVTPSATADGQPLDPQKQEEHKALREKLLQKVRMFGA